MTHRTGQHGNGLATPILMVATGACTTAQAIRAIWDAKRPEATNEREYAANLAEYHKRIVAQWKWLRAVADAADWPALVASGGTARSHSTQPARDGRTQPSVALGIGRVGAVRARRRVRRFFNGEEP